MGDSKIEDLQLQIKVELLRYNELRDCIKKLRDYTNELTNLVLKEEKDVDGEFYEEFCCLTEAADLFESMGDCVDKDECMSELLENMENSWE